MTYAYSFTDHFISFFPFVFLSHSHPVTEPIANTEYKKCVYTTYASIDTIERLARYTTMCVCAYSSTDLGWVCSCPNHKYRGVKCKHIFAVEISYVLHKEVEEFICKS